MGVAAWRPDVELFFSPSTAPNDPLAVPVWVRLTNMFLSCSGLKRGRQYELDQNMAANPTLTFRDPDELLNPGNTGGPYYGQLLPYRRLVWLAMWPNTGSVSGNLINSGARNRATDTPYDPGFEASTLGVTPDWITPVGATTPTVATTTPQQGAQCLSWPVVAGVTSRGVSVEVPCIPGRTYTVSVYVRQTSASTQVLSVDGVAGPSTTTTGTWTRLTQTFTATQPEHVVRVATSGTAVAGTMLLDSLQHEQAGSASAWTATGPVIYSIFRGYIEQYPSSWLHAGKLGHCAMKCVDVFGPLNRFKIETEVRSAIGHTQPLYWWPLNEPNGATAWGEQSGNTGLVLTKTADRLTTDLIFGTTGGNAAFDAGVGTGIAGDPGGLGVELTPSTASTGSSDHSGFGTSLRNPSVPFPATVPYEASLSVWWAGPPADGTFSVPAGINGVLYFFAYNRTYGVPHSTLGVYAYRVVAPGGGSSGVVVNVDFTDPTPRLLTATLSVSASASTLKFYINGTLVGSDVLTPPAATYSTTTTPVALMGDEALGYVAGTYSHLAAWGRVLSAAEVTALYAAGMGGVGETSGQRISRYLSYGWTGQSRVDPGRSVMGVNSLATKTPLLGACQEVATTENGNLWGDRFGQTVLAGRDRRYLATASAVTFGEDVDGGEYPYLEGITYNVDPMRIYNIVNVTNHGGIVTTRSDQASINNFFPNNYDRTINTVDDQEAIDAASWILGENKDPRQRVSVLTFDLASHPRLYAVMLHLEPGTRVTVKTRPSAANSGAGTIIAGDYFVEAVSHDTVDMAGAWKMSLLLSAAPLVQPFILDDPVFGVLDDPGLVLAY